MTARRTSTANRVTKDTTVGRMFSGENAPTAAHTARKFLRWRLRSWLEQMHKGSQKKTNTLVRLPSGERLCECFRYNICWYVARDYVRVPDGSGRERKRVETTAFKGRDELTEQTLGLCLGLDVRASNCWLALTLVLSRYKRHDELQKHQAYKKTQNSSKYIKELL